MSCWEGSSGTTIFNSGWINCFTRDTWRISSLPSVWRITEQPLCSQRCRGLVQMVQKGFFLLFFCWIRTLSPSFTVLSIALLTVCIYFLSIPSPSLQHRSCKQQHHSRFQTSAGSTLTLQEAWFWSGNWITTLLDTMGYAAVCHKENIRVSCSVFQLHHLPEANVWFYSPVDTL